MNTKRCIKWSEGVLDFFSVASDDSIILDIVISYGCKTQTGEYFEELVNAINKEEVKRKIKKINLTDTSYLYRHCIPEFTRYVDKSIETEWVIKNREAIRELQSKHIVEMPSWADGLNDDNYHYWYKQIRKDFAGDEHGNGVVQLFRDVTLSTADKSVSRGDGTLKQCIDFILEECAYTCAFFQNSNMVYPMTLYPIQSMIDRYKLNIHQLTYRLSNNSELHKNEKLDQNELNQEIINFIREKVNNVNFFIIDKHGDFIFKNDSCEKHVKETNAKILAPLTWEKTFEVMEKMKQMNIEEQSADGRFWATVKAPMIVNSRTIGVIGLAVDITNSKKAEELEFKNKLQETELKEREKFQIIADQVAHDIRTPLQTLNMVLECSVKSLPEKEHVALRDSVHSIRKTMQIFLDYPSSDKKISSDHLHILVSQDIEEVIDKRKHQHYGKKVKFQYSFDPALRFTFIYGNATNFERMMSNLINNSVEAFEGRNGVIKINFTADDNNVNIAIQDNGKGMPQKMVEKFMRNEAVATTKIGGFGIGTSQIRDALKEFNGKQFIESTPNVGTKITLTIPKSDKPTWAIEQITLCRGDTVVILDDDVLVHHLWEDRLKKHLHDISLKFFENGQDVVEFINAFKAKDKLTLLLDYELRNQELNGLEIIQKSKLKSSQSIIVSSIYNRKEIQDGAEALDTKILPKAYIEHIEIKLS